MEKSIKKRVEVGGNEWTGRKSRWKRERMKERKEWGEREHNGWKWREWVEEKRVGGWKREGMRERAERLSGKGREWLLRKKGSGKGEEQGWVKYLWKG